MIDDGKLEKLIKPLVKVYEDLELELIKDIAMRLNTYTGIEGSLKWYLDKLQEIGGFTKDNLALLAEYSGKSQYEVKRILKYAGYDVAKLDKYKPYIDDEQLKNNLSSFYESEAVQNILDNSIREANSMMDIIQTKALESAKESYMNILTDAYIKTSSGVYSYDQAIKIALKNLAKEGFTGATYRNGKKLSLESTVRRDILTKSHQLAGDIELQKAKELGTNLVYVTQHLGARIRTKYTKEDYEVHFDWQGKVYMLEGSNDKYDNFYEKTGYGKLLGLCGVNCRHHFFATFEGWKHPALLDAEKNEEEYLKQQKQRAYEREYRSLRYQKEVANILGDKDELRKLNARTRAFNEGYNQFLQENNLQRNYSREYIEKDLIKIDNSTDLKLPKNLIEVLEKQREPNELEEKIIGKYLNKENLKLTNNKEDAMYYSRKYDKIVVNPNHPDLEYYDIYKSLTHEITHMIDNRTGFVRDNKDILLQYMDNSNKYIARNDEFYKKLFESDIVRNNMDISDLFASITNNRVHGRYYHDNKYWKNGTSRQSEMVADMINIYIENNEDTIKIIKSVPSLDKLYGKVVDWYEKNL